MIYLTGSTVEPTRDGPARGMRTTKAFLELEHLAKLDKEVMRRKAHGEDKGPDGKRINVNRSIVIRDLIDQHL